MKKNYFNLEVEVLVLEEEIVRTSGGDNVLTDGNDDYKPYGTNS